uniref:hypothetical protein n=1 Tax=Gemmatimonas sp. TaxID=1962908 RepID=UPI00286C3879
MIGLPRSADGRGSWTSGARCGCAMRMRDADAALRAAITQVQRDFPGYGYRRVTRTARRATSGQSQARAAGDAGDAPATGRSATAMGGGGARRGIWIMVSQSARRGRA